MVRDGKGRLWTGTKLALLRIEGQPGSLQLRHELLPDITDGLREQAVDLEVDSAGRLWAGYDAGIAWLDDDDHWHKIATDRPVTLVRLPLAGDDTGSLPGLWHIRVAPQRRIWGASSVSAITGYGRWTFS
jgi:ligand-binding sensor domain-containing protein